MRNSKKILTHPIFTQAVDLHELCKPLARLGITYFCKVIIHSNGAFSALTNNPRFAKHYLENQYYNVDIHNAARDTKNQFILWDAIDIFGKSAKMHQEASALGVNHTFTIVKSVGDEKHYYHFAADKPGRQINQIYLTYLDLLEQFTTYFNEQINTDPSLRKFHTMTFSDILLPEPEFHLLCNHALYRQQFLDSLRQLPKKQTVNVMEQSDDAVIMQAMLMFPPQQMKCLQILLRGASIKEVARQLMLSPRTVEHHLEKIRKKLGYQTNRKLVSALLSSRGFPSIVHPK